MELLFSACTTWRFFHCLSLLACMESFSVLSFDVLDEGCPWLQCSGRCFDDEEKTDVNEFVSVRIYFPRTPSLTFILASVCSLLAM